MAHTEVFLSNDAGVLVPSITSVSVTSGDTVAFSISGDGPVYAFFSPGAAEVLSPRPSGPVALSSSSPTVFSFTSSQAGSYSVFFETTASAPVPDFPGGESSLLRLVIDTDGMGFGGDANNTKRGVVPASSGS